MCGTITDGHIGGGLLLVAFALEGIFEVVELRQEGRELLVVRIFLEHMMEQAQTYDQLLGMFFGEVLFLSGQGGKFHQVMMTAEVEIQSLPDFTVDHLGDVDVIGAFYLVVIIAVTAHNFVCFSCF